MSKPIIVRKDFFTRRKTITSVRIVGEQGFLPHPGNAAIIVAGRHLLDGQHTDVRYPYSFEIKDLNGKLVLRNVPELAGGICRGSHVIRNAAGDELARIQYEGFLGSRKSICIQNDVMKYPRGRTAVLTGATITIDHRTRSAHLEIADESRLLAYVGVAYYWWLRSIG